jgi:hypothetical protein
MTTLKRRVTTHVAQRVRAVCHRHCYRLVIARRRMFLRCEICGEESPGYAFDGGRRLVEIPMKTNEPIRDQAGRVVAPPQDFFERAPGPWDRNHAPLVVICAWCPTFDPTDPINAHATHGMCPSCAQKFMGDMA